MLRKAACGVPVSPGCRGQALCFAKPPAASPFSSGCRGQALCCAKPPAASPFLFGVQGFESAKAHLIRKRRLCLPSSDLALCATRGMVQTAFSVFSKGKEISFLTWSSALPPVSQSADSLFLRLWLLPLSAPGSGRTQSPGNPSVTALKQKKHHAFRGCFIRKQKYYKF